jgi:hypothetical protein
VARVVQRGVQQQQRRAARRDLVGHVPLPILLADDPPQHDAERTGRLGREPRHSPEAAASPVVGILDPHGFDVVAREQDPPVAAALPRVADPRLEHEAGQQRCDRLAT